MLMRFRLLPGCLAAAAVLVAAASRLKSEPAAATSSRQDAAKSGQATIPPAPEVYKGRRIARTMHYAGAPWLVRESRQREEDCKRLLEELKLEPGQVVCDLGCGNGFYALPLAERVGPRGRVYAVDVQPEMLKLLRDRAEKQGVENVEGVLGTPVDPRLPQGKFDLILLVDVYHEFSHPEQMLAKIRAALKPDGRVALAEFRGEDPEVPIKPLHKMSKKQILKEWLPAGFKLTGQFDGLPWQHLMFFQRHEDEPQSQEDAN